MLNALLDGLSYLGDSADKLGGREFRGLLGGKPRELLSFVPFSDRMGLTDPGDIVRGRDLTDQLGMTNKGDDHWSSHATGMAAEALLDPSLLVAGGMKTAPRLAARWGLVGNADTAARLAGKRASQSGHLGLKFDDYSRIKTAEDARIPRHDPDWINNRTFYHGTGTPGLTAESLDPRKTSAGSLHGYGIYTSEEAGNSALPVTAGYAATRAKEGTAQAFRDLFSPQRTLQAADQGKLTDDYISSLLSSLGHSDIQASQFPTRPGIRAAFARQHLEEIARLLAENPTGRGTSSNIHMNAPIVKQSMDIFGRPPGIAPSIYQAQSGFNKILDLESGDRSAQEAVRNAFGTAGQHAPITAEDRLRSLMSLRGMGYDAMTHSGGARLGGDYHQVVVGLDPNNVLGVGKASPYQRWEPVPGIDKLLMGGQ